MSEMQEALSLGVEEEFQIIEATTTKLAHGYEALMRHATPEIHENMKPEFVQCVVECITNVCPDVAAVHKQTMALRATVALMARAEHMAIVSAGTHPTSKWYEQRRSAGDRYGMLEEALQDVVRSILIYGLHVHVCVNDEALRIDTMNQARTFLPYILALSANSPFWMGRKTGFMSFRTMIWAPFPFAGIPDAFSSLEEYHHFREFFRNANTINDVRRVWWDIRSHDLHPTIEFRIADMPMHHEDMIALVAFIQAIVKTIIQRTRAGKRLPVYPASYIAENRWRAARAGVRGMAVDLARGIEIPMADAINDALDLVSPAAAELGTSHHITHLRSMLDPNVPTAAERQIAAYHKRFDPRDVTRLLIAETMRDIDLTSALPLASVAKSREHGMGAAFPFIRRRSAQHRAHA